MRGGSARWWQQIADCENRGILGRLNRSSVGRLLPYLNIQFIPPHPPLPSPPRYYLICSTIPQLIWCVVLGYITLIPIFRSTWTVPAARRQPGRPGAAAAAAEAAAPDTEGAAHLAGGGGSSSSGSSSRRSGQGRAAVASGRSLHCQHHEGPDRLHDPCSPRTRLVRHPPNSPLESSVKESRRV